MVQNHLMLPGITEPTAGCTLLNARTYIVGLTLGGFLRRACTSPMVANVDGQPRYGRNCNGLGTRRAGCVAMG